MKASIPSAPQIRAASVSALGAGSIVPLTLQPIRKSFLVSILAAGCFIATSMLVASTASAEVDPRIAKSMETLKALTAKLGAPKVEGNDPAGGKDVYFGTTKVNNDFDIVDAVGREDGKGMTATL